MEFSSDFQGRAKEITDLFTATFTASEGAGEGDVVGGLAAKLLASTPVENLFVFCADKDETLVGTIIFSRICFAEDQRLVFVLSPVAVKTGEQGKGIGQGLLAHGLEVLRGNGVDVVVTYGDPAFYAKVGFQQMTPEFAQPPYTLSYPHGWLGQALNGGDMKPLAGASCCVPALNDASLW